MSTKDKILARNHDDVLEQIAKRLDISQSMYEKAEDRYKSIGDWLDREESDIAKYDPEISPQGSFLLGTVTKPPSDADDYDVDLICLLRASKKDFTQKELKESVGREVKGYMEAHGMINPAEEGRRCWTVHYADDACFHMDVLPALPDSGRFQLMLESRGHKALAANQSLTDHALSITDKTHPTYAQFSDDWPQSNPKGYAAWFKQRMRVRLHDQKRLFVERSLITASVDDIPDYKVKTPLQRAIQLLKRHRDVLFADDPDHKPISIIITTLAAHAYNEEGTVSEALRNILQSMDGYIHEIDGEFWVANPVNPDENFADKWSEEPRKRDNFFRWLNQARLDFATYLRSPFNSIPDSLKSHLGEKVVASVQEGLSSLTNDTTGDLPQSARTAAAVDQIRRSGSQSRPWSKGL